MKKYCFFKLVSSIICSLFILTASTFSQTDAPGDILILKGNPAVNNVYVAPDPSFFDLNKVQTATITVIWIGTWNLKAKGAFQNAVNIWSKSIISSVPIIINAEYKKFSIENIYPNTVLGYAKAELNKRGFGSTHPSYFVDTFYALPLANKLKGSDLNPELPDIVAVFNKDRENDFYFDFDPYDPTKKAPNTKYDFVSVALHEIAHGLGFSTTVKKNINGELVYKSDGYPSIYDLYIVKNNGIKLTSLTSPSSDLTNFLTSNDLFWDGAEGRIANGNIRPKLYAPTTFEEGSSIGHLNDATFDSDGGNALMTSYINKGESIYDPGSVGIGMMTDIGWEAVLWSGIEDDLVLKSYTGNIPNIVISDPITYLSVGGTYGYTYEFTDNEPYGDIFAPSKWTLEIIHNTGKYLLHSGNFSFSQSLWSFTLSDLPAGYQWARTMDGKVRAVLTLYGNDYGNSVYSREEPLEVTINYVPNKPEVKIRNVHVLGNGSVINSPLSTCSTAEISFFADGATSYRLVFKPISSTGRPGVIDIPNYQYSYIISDLDEWEDYICYVQAYNSYGSVISDPTYRYSCKQIIIVVPNPAFDYVRFIMKKEIRKISDVELRKIDNSGPGKHVIINPPRKEVEISIAELTPGYYSAKIKDDENAIYTETFLIQ